MANLLFPGRHHMLTNFQMNQMTLLTEASPGDLLDVNGTRFRIKEKIDKIIWVVTSANHSNTRRNPLPSHRREAMIEDFSRNLNAESFVYHIDDIGASDRFAQYVIKKIEVDSQGKLLLTPENTIVGCSTPEVIAMYENEGFQIAPFELVDREKRIFKAELPWDLVERIIGSKAEGRDWRTDPDFLTKASSASRRLYTKYGYGDQLIELFEDPLLGNDGDITDTRNYNTYARAFDDGAKRKYEIIKNIAKPGRFVDIGCCTGALIGELTRDERFRESDFYGIEVARALFQECIHRKQNGYFANQNVFFYQRNVATGRIFPENSIDTFTTFSLTHEIESYQGRETLLKFISLLQEQLKYGGKWINVDVVGPRDGNKIVHMTLNTEDGRNEDWEKKFIPGDKALKEYLDGLSTYARFLRFAHDFRKKEGDQIDFKILEEGLIKIDLRAACEFLSKKDYTDNWESEMHEKFCYWSLEEWEGALNSVGLKVSPESFDFSNPWIIENRFRGKVLFHEEGGAPMDYPVTNMVLVAEK